MRKKSGIVYIVIIILCLFVACNARIDINNKESENIVTDKNTLNENNSNNKQGNISENNLNISTSEIVGDVEEEGLKISKVLDSVASISKLDSSFKLTKSQIKEKFNFGELINLEIDIRSNISEDNIIEIAIVKLEDTNQTIQLFNVMMSRLIDLKEQYKNNEKILKILNSNDCYVLKQQGGVVISIISEDAKVIEEKIQESF